MSFEIKESFISTGELADLFQVKPETIRTALCLNGHYCGITPIKLPNRLLAWPTRCIPEIILNYQSGLPINVSFAECFGRGNAQKRNKADKSGDLYE